MDASMILYIKPGCPWCVAVEEYLTKHQYKYQRVNVFANPAHFAEMKQLSGQHYAPTMTVNGKILADFDVEQLSEFLSKHQITP